MSNIFSSFRAGKCLVVIYPWLRQGLFILGSFRASWTKNDRVNSEFKKMCIKISTPGEGDKGGEVQTGINLYKRH